MRPMLCSIYTNIFEFHQQRSWSTIIYRLSERHLSHWLNAVDMNMKFNDKPHYLMILFNVNKKLDNHDIKG